MNLFRLLCLIVVMTYPLYGQQQSVCITIDDLPVVTQIRTAGNMNDITTRLLAALHKYNVPAVGFVNEGKLYNSDTLLPERKELLRKWLAAGIELGNHTFSHWDANRTPQDKYFGDILRGEIITKQLSTDADKPFRYFRHPFLRTGKTPDDKRRLDSFLVAHHYIVAPVTIDNSDWIFASAYEKSLIAGDTGATRRIAAEYVPYMMSKCAFYERNARELFGRNIRQILLIHANRLNADNLGELLTAFSQRGYRFATLEETLQDEAYGSDDNFTGYGISWLHRWAKTRGADKSLYAGEPSVPKYVMDYAGVESE